MSIIRGGLEKVPPQVKVFWGMFYDFSWVFFYGFLGLDCKEPVRVTRRGLILVFCGYFCGFPGLVS